MESSEIHQLTWEQAKIRSKTISEVSYTLQLGLTKQDTYCGNCTVQFTSSQQGSTWLQLKATQVKSLKVNNTEKQINWVNWKLSLPDITPGPNTAQIEFTNTYSKDGFGLHKFIDPADNQVYLFTQFEPFAANKMFPCFDQPDLKASLQLKVLSPTEWVIIANEVSTSKIPAEQALKVRLLPEGTQGEFTWIEFPPTAKISSYLYALCAGPYVQYRNDDNQTGVPLALYCRKELTKFIVPQRYFRWTITGLKFYNEFFGTPYAFGEYDQIFVPEFNFGAMENVGCVTFKQVCIFKDPPSPVQIVRILDVFMHQMAHMWFGNLVTMKWWNDLWLNESFATFMSHLCMSRAYDQEGKLAWIQFLKLKGWGYNTDQMSTTHPISTPVRDTDETLSNVDGISYAKGSSVLKQLFFIVGFDVFKGAIQKYMRDFAFRNAEFDDLIRYISTQAQENGVQIDIPAWADSWIRTAGLNELEPVVEYDQNGNLVSFSIKQSAASAQHPTLRDHFILVEAFDSSMSSLKQEKIHVKAQEITEIDCFNGLQSSALMMNIGDWDFCKIRIDAKSLSFFKQNLYKLEDPLSKQLVWRALIDMMNDIKLSAVQFIQLVLAQIPQQTDASIANYALDACMIALKSYIAEIDTQKQLSHSLFTMSYDKMVNAVSNQDSTIFQKILLSFLLHEQDLLRVVGWVKEKDTGIPGFSLGLDEKWDVIKKYAVVSEDAGEVLRSELEVDSSDTAQLGKLFCQAAFPTLDAKSKTWEFYMNNFDSLSRYERKSSMEGFNRGEQREILASFTQLYFEKAIEFIQNKDKEIASDFCVGLVPNYIEDQEKIQRIDWLVERIPEDRFKLIRDLKEIQSQTVKSQRAKNLSTEYLRSKSN